MKLSEFKKHLSQLTQLNFVQLNGHYIPRHFHITEVGLVTKHFIDCGGTVRTENAVNFQIWVAQDIDHRLEPQKLLKIIALSENLFPNQDLDIEVEYQTESISKFGLDFNGHNFLFTAKQTNCLAKDHCGIPESKLQLVETETTSCCSPGGKCC